MDHKLTISEKLLQADGSDGRKLGSASSSRNYAACGQSADQANVSAPLVPHAQESRLESEEKRDQSNALVDDVKLPLRDLIKQVMLLWEVLIACIVHSVVIQAGINLSFSAVLLPQLEEEYNNATQMGLATASNVIRIDTDAASWIASLVTLPLPLGALIVGTLMDKWGRKRIAMLCTVPFSVSWLMHFGATHVRTIYLARIIAGFGSGLSAVSIIYVAELSHPRHRAVLLNLNSLFVCFGILLTCVAGAVLHWRRLSLCYAILSMSSCVALTLVPESPHWLHAFKGRAARATAILAWLYSNEKVYALEECRLWEGQRQAQAQTSGMGCCHLAHCWRTLQLPTVHKPLVILLFLFLLQQLTGCYVIVFYAIDVFKRVGDGSGLDEYQALVVLGAIRFVASMVSAVASIRVGRKVVMVASAAGMVGTALLAACTSGVLTSWCLLAYVACGSIGILIIPWTLIGELLPLQVRGKLGGLLCALAYLYMFALVKSFPYLVSIVEMRALFYYTAGVNVVLCYFIVTCVPETFRKTFGEIEAHFLL